MADLRGAYEVNDQPSVGFEVLPAGEYVVKIENAVWKETKNQDGQYLQINMAVADGEHSGAPIIDRLNLKNRNDMAVKIARGQFAALREAVGVAEPKDSADLENIRFRVVLKCVKRNDDPSKMTNEVSRYLKLGGGVKPQQHNGAPPWSRNAPAQSLATGPAPSGNAIPF